MRSLKISKEILEKKSRKDKNLHFPYKELEKFCIYLLFSWQIYDYFQPKISDEKIRYPIWGPMIPDDINKDFRRLQL